MKLSDLTDPAALRKALDQFDTLGRDHFLEKHGFGKARSYFVKRDGKLYDSKAIFGAAFAFQHPNRKRPASSDFTGGEHTVAGALRALGFEVITTEASTQSQTLSDLKPGDELTNGQLMSVFGCGTSGGMRRSHKTKSLIIVSDPTKGLYVDEWRGHTLHYTGMGLRGDQSLDSAQNRTLAESRSSGVQVHLFEVHREHVYTYVGPVTLEGDPYESQQADADNRMRRVWIFPVRPINSSFQSPIPLDTLQKVQARQRKNALALSNNEIAARARRSTGRPASRKVTTTVFVRDEFVAENAKRRARGICDLCCEKAPFADKNGRPYLETHHVKWLARGGEDTIDNTVALCPNCHRRMHVVDLVADRNKLRARINARAQLTLESTDRRVEPTGRRTADLE